MYREVTMYRIECDAEGCERSPSDGSEYYAWREKEGAEDDLHNAWDWYDVDEKHLCPDHAPRRCNSCDGFHEVTYSEEHGGNLCPKCLERESAAGKDSYQAGERMEP